MLDNEHIPTQQEAIEYFRANGRTEQYAINWWERESKFGWKSKYPIVESADHWIANARPDERLPPPKVYKPFGRTERERYMSCKQFILEADCHTDPELLASAQQLYEQMRAKQLTINN